MSFVTKVLNDQAARNADPALVEFRELVRDMEAQIRELNDALKASGQDARFSIKAVEMTSIREAKISKGNTKIVDFGSGYHNEQKLSTIAYDPNSKVSGPVFGRDAVVAEIEKAVSYALTKAENDSIVANHRAQREEVISAEAAQHASEYHRSHSL